MLTFAIGMTAAIRAARSHLSRRWDARLCRCSHPYVAHRHDRPGTDCSGLAPDSAGGEFCGCPRFRWRVVARD